MDISTIKKDPEKIDEGQWVSDIPDMGDLRLKVRGLSSVKFRNARAKLERAVVKKDRERDGSLKPSVAMRVMGEAMAETGLIDWDGLTEGGNPVKYNKTLAREWLTNPAFESFLDACVWAARVVDAGEEDVEKEVSEN